MAFTNVDSSVQLEYPEYLCQYIQSSLSEAYAQTKRQIIDHFDGQINYLNFRCTDLLAELESLGSESFTDFTVSTKVTDSLAVTRTSSSNLAKVERFYEPEKGVFVLQIPTFVADNLCLGDGQISIKDKIVRLSRKKLNGSVKSSLQSIEPEIDTWLATKPLTNSEIHPSPRQKSCSSCLSGQTCGESFEVLDCGSVSRRSNMFSVSEKSETSQVLDISSPPSPVNSIQPALPDTTSWLCVTENRAPSAHLEFDLWPVGLLSSDQSWLPSASAASPQQPDDQLAAKSLFPTKDTDQINQWLSQSTKVEEKLEQLSKKYPMKEEDTDREVDHSEVVGLVCCRTKSVGTCKSFLQCPQRATCVGRLAADTQKPSVRAWLAHHQFIPETVQTSSTDDIPFQSPPSSMTTLEQSPMGLATASVDTSNWLSDKREDVMEAKVGKRVFSNPTEQENPRDDQWLKKPVTSKKSKMTELLSLLPPLDRQDFVLDDIATIFQQSRRHNWFSPNINSTATSKTDVDELASSLANRLSDFN